MFYEAYSILLERQSQASLNRILANFENFILEITKTKDEMVPFRLEVIYMLLKQNEEALNKLTYTSIIQNQVFMDLILEGVMTGKAEMAEVPLRILIFLSSLKKTLEVKSTPLLNTINIKLFPIIYDFLISVNSTSAEQRK